MIINMEDVYETVGGLRVEILKVLPKGKYPVIGLVDVPLDGWCVHEWSCDGQQSRESLLDYALRIPCKAPVSLEVGSRVYVDWEIGTPHEARLLHNFECVHTKLNYCLMSGAEFAIARARRRKLAIANIRESLEPYVTLATKVKLANRQYLPIGSEEEN